MKNENFVLNVNRAGREALKRNIHTTVVSVNRILDAYHVNEGLPRVTSKTLQEFMDNPAAFFNQQVRKDSEKRNMEDATTEGYADLYGYKFINPIKQNPYNPDHFKYLSIKDGKVSIKENLDELIKDVGTETTSDPKEIEVATQLMSLFADYAYFSTLRGLSVTAKPMIKHGGAKDFGFSPMAVGSLQPGELQRIISAMEIYPKEQFLDDLVALTGNHQFKGLQGYVNNNLKK